MEQFEKVCKGLKYAMSLPLSCIGNQIILNSWVEDAIALIRQQQERIGELEKYRRLQVHNIGNVDIPDGVTMEQFCEIMDGVIKALEHTEKGESWPYKPPKEEEQCML